MKAETEKTGRFAHRENHGRSEWPGRRGWKGCADGCAWIFAGAGTVGKPVVVAVREERESTFPLAFEFVFPVIKDKSWLSEKESSWRRYQTRSKF